VRHGPRLRLPTPARRGLPPIISAENGESASDYPPADVVQVVLDLGLALGASGYPVSLTREALRRVAAAYHANVQVTVLPAAIFAKVQGAEAAIVDLTAATAPRLRLDQAGSIFTIAQRVQAGEMPPLEAVAAIRAVWRQPPRFRPLTRALGSGLLAMGLATTLGLGLTAAIWCLVIGTITGLARLLGERYPAIQPLIPAGAAFAVGLLTFEMLQRHVIGGSVLLVVPPLVPFFPGSMLATAMVELANGDMVPGGSRLVWSAGQLAVLMFGLACGAQVSGVDEQLAFAAFVTTAQPWWTGLVGVGIYGAGVYLTFAGARHSLPWLYLVLFVAWSVQRLGAQEFSGYLSSSGSATIVLLLALALESRPGAPPALVSFLPAFWLLIPGSLGLIGMGHLVSKDEHAALSDLIEMAFTVIAVALGLLAGLLIGAAVGLGSMGTDRE
jgi:uncharacterized membrane protein YjjP (DUF1212 family)